MCISCILAVDLDWIVISKSGFLLHFPPLLPRNPIVNNLFFFACSIAFKIFLLFPDVDMTIKTSLLLPRASICLENKFSKP